MRPIPSTEDRVVRWLHEEAVDDVPDRVLQAAFVRTRQRRQRRVALGRAVVLPRRTALAMAATLLITGTLLGISLAGGWPWRQVALLPSRDALRLVLDAGVLRVAVRPEHPQRVLPDGRVDGFDVDVGREIARRLGIGLSVAAFPSAEMLTGGPWDIGLPSTPGWSVDGDAYLVSSAYYFWPHLLVVHANSSARTLTDVQGQPICAVEGDAAQRWLMGSYGAPATSPVPVVPIPSSLILRASDAECLAALTAGDAHAAVTATTSPADIAAREELRVIGGPPPEARTVILTRDGPDPTSLLESVNRVIDDMRTDGTIARLSSERFGTDLSSNGGEQ
jgi:polar amino acid transport system substrate-binding protein